MNRTSRRSLLQWTATAGVGLYAAGCMTASRRHLVTDGPLRHACIGVGGMGGTDLKRIGSHADARIVALCDVDRNFLEQAAEAFPEARLYRDWRELLAVEHGNIDSVSVTTPDHMHASITIEALARGKHVHCQKPLTRTVQEARAVAAAARRAGVVTQMGIQNRSNAPYAQARQLFQAGHIGRVHQVHVWTDRPRNWWPQGVDRPAGQDPIPEHLDWDGWLGVAPYRPYKKGAYHNFRWRGFKDFGTGAQGDMGCHLIDPAVWFLGLEAPLRVRSSGPSPNGETYPSWSRVHYEFPPNRHTTRGPLLLTWYDGGKKVWKDILEELEAGEVWDNGCLLMGEHGALLASPYSPPRLLPESRFGGIEIPDGETNDHWHQYVDACLGRTPTSAPFKYSAFLTEVALLGNTALHFPHETLEWDARRMRFPHRPEADRYLSQPGRKDWSVAKRLDS